ncbi:MAG: CRTAC1 family protein [Planctomycetota bacterium]
MLRLHLGGVRRLPLVLLSLVTAAVPSLAAPQGVTFRDVVADGSAGIHYQRSRSPRDAIFEALKQQTFYVVPDDVKKTPLKPRGTPGVCLFDYDGDGDLDVYVTNGPGTPNSLFANRLRETGNLVFEDVAIIAGVAASAQDSAGVVAGDIDNDDDLDLYVLGIGGPNLLFENRGDGTFVDITAASGTSGGARTSQSATLGDVNGDGLLDLFVGNATDFDQQIAIFEPFPAVNEHNQLWVNQGGNVFHDVSATAGVETQQGFPPGFENAPSFTHVCSLVDYDLDGDVDLLTGDDQGAIPPTVAGGADNGLLHLFENGGRGRFRDVNVAAGINKIGGWMGIAFADFNADGLMDFFGTNFGSYAEQNFPVVIAPGQYDSRWFLAQPDGTFDDPGVGSLVAIPFGWGTSALDYDNDGDTDLVFHGGLDLGPLVTADNPGVILQNDGAAHFSYDAAALAASTNHSRRIVHGVAAGDLNDDGFVDIVSVSNFDYPEPNILIPFTALGSPFDPTAAFIPTFLPTPISGAFQLNLAIPPLPDGSLSVEINSADNGAGWVAVQLRGSVGTLRRGRVNRCGIGAVVTFQPAGAAAAMRPVVAGSSYASQDSLTANFGMGTARFGTVDVLWPGGVRNRLYDVRRGERLRFPEIPVSYDDPSLSQGRYVTRVARSLLELRAAGVVTSAEAARFFFSAIYAYLEVRV